MSLTAEDMKKVSNIITGYEAILDLSVRIPLAEYHERYKKVWSELDKRNIDLGFFFWYREMPGDGLYLTGYNPTIERASAVMTPGKAPMLLVGPESGILSKEVGLNLETHFVKEFSIPDEYYEGVTCDSLPEVVRNYAGREIKKIGFMTSLDVVPHKFFQVIKDDIVKNVTLTDASDILAELRYEKSENEFACMKQADMIASAATRAMLAVIKPGMRELEAAAVGDFGVDRVIAVGFGDIALHCRELLVLARDGGIERSAARGAHDLGRSGDHCRADQRRQRRDGEGQRANATERNSTQRETSPASGAPPALAGARALCRPMVKLRQTARVGGQSTREEG
jgi:hypothetical protein